MSSKPPFEGPRYFDRELSWLAFNQRVLDEAVNSDTALLERVKFLAISSSNLDEFHRVRVGGLHVKAHRLADTKAASELTILQQSCRDFAEAQTRCWLDDLVPALSDQDITIRHPATCTSAQTTFLNRFMERELLPVLTPMAVPPDLSPLAFRNLTIYVAVRLSAASDVLESPRWACIPIDPGPPRLLSLSSESGRQYVLLEDVIQAHADRFFPGETIEETAVLRLTRNADLELHDEHGDDLMSRMEELLAARRVSGTVRVEMGAEASTEARKFFCRLLQVDLTDLVATEGLIDYTALFALAGLDGFDELRNKAWLPIQPPEVKPDRPVFDAIAECDILLHHPYESFDPVVRLLEEAADDPQVLAIKQVLYRVSSDSPIVAALLRAAEHGKNVTVLVELKARFDEAANIGWARALRDAGVQVIYGVRGYKTHAKVLIIVRREAAGIRRYTHFGTGNYNDKTARLYGDVSLMTSQEEFGADASSFFNAICGYSKPQDMLKLASAPIDLRSRLLEQIEVECALSEQDQPARITAKLNSLQDTGMVDALYAASQRGVQIDLNVRGICTLRPGVPGLSENIRVVSIVDRYLEHSRIIRFAHGGSPVMYISSADWMSRNLDRRIELLVPVEDARCQKRLSRLLDTCFLDNINAWELQSDGMWRRRRPDAGEEVFSSQQALYEEAQERMEKARAAQTLVFEPHRGDP